MFAKHVKQYRPLFHGVESAGGAVLRRIPVPRNKDSRAEKHAARSRHSFSSDRRLSRRRKSCSVRAAATWATTVPTDDGNEYIGGHVG